MVHKASPSSRLIHTLILTSIELGIKMALPFSMLGRQYRMEELIVSGVKLIKHLFMCVCVCVGGWVCVCLWSTALWMQAISGKEKNWTPFTRQASHHNILKTSHSGNTLPCCFGMNNCKVVHSLKGTVMGSFESQARYCATHPYTTLTCGYGAYGSFHWGL